MDELTRLEEENKRMVTALEEIEKLYHQWVPLEGRVKFLDDQVKQAHNIARKALLKEI